MGKYAAIVPASMVDDEPVLRAYLTSVAQVDGVAVPESAVITARVVTSRFGAQSVGVAEVEVS